MASTKKHHALMAVSRADTIWSKLVLVGITSAGSAILAMAASWFTMSEHMATKNDLEKLRRDVIDGIGPYVAERRLILDYIESDRKNGQIVVEKLQVVQENVARIGVKIDFLTKNSSGGGSK